MAIDIVFLQLVDFPEAVLFSNIPLIFTLNSCKTYERKKEIAFMNP